MNDRIKPFATATKLKPEEITAAQKYVTDPMQEEIDQLVHEFEKINLVRRELDEGGNMRIVFQGTPEHIARMKEGFKALLELTKKPKPKQEEQTLPKDVKLTSSTSGQAAILRKSFKTANKK